MFGLFKKKISPTEFGQGIVHLAGSWLSNDAGASLGMRFQDFDGSGGWMEFLERKGVPFEFRHLYSCTFGHCAIQAACTQFNEGVRREITIGAMENLLTLPPGYDIGQTYSALDRIYRGHHKFDPELEALRNDEFRIIALPNPQVGVLNAKYLLENLIIPNMTNSRAFIAEFNYYSGSVTAAVGTVCRAIEHLRGLAVLKPSYA